jgi:hypothetical protein
MMDTMSQVVEVEAASEREGVEIVAGQEGMFETTAEAMLVVA